MNLFKAFAFLFALSFILHLTTNLNAQTIVIDAGHGYNPAGENPDSRSPIEVEAALDVALRLKKLMQSTCPKWTVLLTRPDPTGWVSVAQRVAMTNSWNADYFLSIHCNTGGAIGTETFWCKRSQSDPTDDINFATRVQNEMTTAGQFVNRRVSEDRNYLPYHLGVLSGTQATACLSEIGFVDS